jgi:hypothetical protein
MGEMETESELRRSAHGDAYLGSLARLLRGQPNIGDFTRWKSTTATKSFERLMRDLRVSPSPLGRRFTRPWNAVKMGAI